MLVIGVAISLDVPKKLQLPSNPLCQSKWCYCPCGKRGATRGCDWPKFRKNLKDFFQEDDICKKLSLCWFIVWIYLCLMLCWVSQQGRVVWMRPGHKGGWGQCQNSAAAFLSPAPWSASSQVTQKGDSRGRNGTGVLQAVFSAEQQEKVKISGNYHPSTGSLLPTGNALFQGLVIC